MASAQFFVPAHGEMLRRHTRDDAICPMCGIDDEMLFHVLVQCDHALLFWREAEDFFQVSLPRLHPATWSKDILDHTNEGGCSNHNLCDVGDLDQS